MEKGLCKEIIFHMGLNSGRDFESWREEGLKSNPEQNRGKEVPRESA